MHFESIDFDFNNAGTTKIIAEIGVNHNGDPELAKRMVDAAVRAGADIIKFQAFRSEKEISKFADAAPYQKKATQNNSSQLEMCKALELSPQALRELKAYCAQIKAPFLCAAFDYDSLDFLIDDLKLETIKIPSSEVTHLPFLEYIGSKKKAVILSTGASYLSEVALAVETLRQAGCPEMLLFHCVSSYPAPGEQANLRAIVNMKTAFNLPVGFSDHTIGNTVSITAAALGASAIEKHFTLDRSMPGPDHKSSIEPDELRRLVDAVRLTAQSMGDGIKRPVPCEMENLTLIRKGMVASMDLPKGTQLTKAMVEYKRPAHGVAPMDEQKVWGMTLQRPVMADEPIRWDDLR